MSTELQKLPTLEELYTDSDLTLPEKIGTLNVLLNQAPDEKWIKKNKFANNTDYIPIERQEWLLTYVCGRWHVEVLSVQLIANSVCAIVRVHFYDRTSNEMRWTDGVGAVPIQIKKDSGGAIDFSNMQSNAIQLAAPAAKSFAFKDAVESLGRLFGRDLNRKEQISYDKMLPGAWMSEVISEQQAEWIRAALVDEKVKTDKFLAVLGVDSIEAIPAARLRDAEAMLNQRQITNKHSVTKAPK